MLGWATGTERQPFWTAIQGGNVAPLSETFMLLPPSHTCSPLWKSYRQVNLIQKAINQPPLPACPNKGEALCTQQCTLTLCLVATGQHGASIASHHPLSKASQFDKAPFILLTYALFSFHCGLDSTIPYHSSYSFSVTASKPLFSLSAHPVQHIPFYQFTQPIVHGPHIFPSTFLVSFTFLPPSQSSSNITLNQNVFHQ